MPTSTVEYAALLRPENYTRKDCRLFRDGRGPYAGHCSFCDDRLRRIALERERHRYKVYDSDGRVIVSWRL